VREGLGLCEEGLGVRGMERCMKLFHRITEWQGLEGTLGDHLVQTPAKAGSPRADCTGPRLGGV